MDFILAHSRYSRHKFKEAIQVCDGLLNKNPQDEAAWVLKCQCLFKENYFDHLEAEQDSIAEQLLAEQETNKLARVGTSFRAGSSSNPIMRPMTSGRLNTGFQRIGTSVGSRAGSRSNSMLRTGKVMTRGGVPSTSNGRILRLSTASLEMHGQNFFDSSKVDLRKIAKRKSKARLVYQYLFYVEHNLKKALELGVYATEANNFEDPWWKLAVGRCYYHLNFYPEAQKQLLSSVKHNNNVEAFLYLSRIYEKQDNVQKAFQILRQCAEAHPFEPKTHIYTARLHNQLNNLDSAIEEYKKVLSSENCNIEAVASFASNFFYKDQAQISTKLYQRLIELGYDSSQVWSNLGLCCVANNQFQLFQKCFQRAISLSRGDSLLSSDVWYNIGYTYVILGEVEMAMEAFKISISYFSENVEAMNNIAVIESQGGDLTKAISWAERSFKQFPTFETAFNLSVWHFQSHQYQKAYQFNREALRMYPQHVESVQLQSLLLRKLQNL